MATSVSERNLFETIKSYYNDAVSQKHFDWLGKQSLDIFIPSKNVAIEYQGEQHYMPIGIYGGKRGLRKQKSLDKDKLKLCKKNGIKILYFTFEQSAPDKLHGKKMYKNIKKLLYTIKHPTLSKLTLLFD